MSAKKFIIFTICIVVCCLGLLGGFTAYVDPFFHYHAPQKGIEYPINNQRYQNDGILKHFKYNAIITGTSMTENFKTSEFDSLFDAQSVKVPFSGSYFKETNDRLISAFESGNHIKYVVRTLDNYAITADKNTVSDFDYPYYLYDNNILNDTRYLFNKSVLSHSLETLAYSYNGNSTTSFDEYSSWSDNFNYGREHVLQRYTREPKSETAISLTESDIQRIKQNLQQNIVSLAIEHPDTQFYLYFPPYSIFHWDSWNQRGYINAGIDVLQLTTEYLLEYDNIHVFSFDTCFDIICDLNNYKDHEHHGDWINSKILIWMKNDEHKLTKENYIDHFDTMREFYTTYNYDALFK